MSPSFDVAKQAQVAALRLRAAACVLSMLVLVGCDSELHEGQDVSWERAHKSDSIDDYIKYLEGLEVSPNFLRKRVQSERAGAALARITELGMTGVSCPFSRLRLDVRDAGSGANFPVLAGLSRDLEWLGIKRVFEEPFDATLNVSIRKAAVSARYTDNVARETGGAISGRVYWEDMPEHAYTFEGKKKVAAIIYRQPGISADVAASMDSSGPAKAFAASDFRPQFAKLLHHKCGVLAATSIYLNNSHAGPKYRRDKSLDQLIRSNREILKPLLISLASRQRNSMYYFSDETPAAIEFLDELDPSTVSAIEQAHLISAHR